MSSPSDLKHKPWVEKDWTKWTEWDCWYVTSYSPWAWFDEGGGREFAPSNPRHFNTNSPLNYSGDYAEIRSALPIRQAKLRLLQLQKHYDKMSHQMKAAFDQEHAGDLAGGDNDFVRVLVNHTAFEYNYKTKALVNLFPARQAALKLPDGRLLLSNKTIVASATSAEYFFPRMVDGKPLYTASDDNFTIVFGVPLRFDEKHKELGPEKAQDFYLDESVKKYDFPIASLMYHGKLEY